MNTAYSIFVAGTLAVISLLIVPPRTDSRIIREIRAGGVKVERAQTLQAFVKHSCG
jgi:hypothetical protein